MRTQGMIWCFHVVLVLLPGQATVLAAGGGAPPAKDFTDAVTGMEFVLVPGGEFMMGSDEGSYAEKPPHQVRVSAFYLGKHEVTVGQYLACVADKGCPEPEWREPGSKYHHQSGTDDHYKKLGTSLTGLGHPIVGVSWDNAQSFVSWLKKKSGKAYRLPAEAEWEYAACSGGKNEKWSGTNDESRLKDHVWYAENSGETTHEVGSRQANGLGLHDMNGHVWEWVQDCWHAGYAANPPVDGSAWESECLGSGLVARGGSWHDPPMGVRVTVRDRGGADTRGPHLGFRLALPLDPEKHTSPANEPPARHTTTPQSTTLRQRSQSR